MTAAACASLRDSVTFQNLITLTIIVVGVIVGLDADASMRCDRLTTRVHLLNKTLHDAAVNEGMLFADDGVSSTNEK